MSEPFHASDHDEAWDETPPLLARMGDERLNLSFDSWEGPLDLLLMLARNQKVDLREISILALVEQYLAYIERARVIRLEVAADYLVMAAWLAFLKSGLLLPRVEQPDPSPEELALRLHLRLQRLNAMREAGARLMARDLLHRDIFVRAAPEGLHRPLSPVWTTSLYDLMTAYGQVRARTRPVVHVVARRPVMTLDEAIERVGRLLGTALDWSSLESFLPEEADPQLRRSAKASSFVAALELARQRRLDLKQASPFAPLYLRAVGETAEAAE
jgi:segregation and condensation protein A